MGVFRAIEEREFTIGVLVGWLADRFGAPRVLMGGSVCLMIATYLFYADTKLGSAFLLPLYTLVGLTVGVVGAVPSIMVKSFPPVDRSWAGLGFCSSTGREANSESNQAKS